MDKWKLEDKKLQTTADRVDYDVDSFSKNLTDLLDGRIKYLTSLRGKLLCSTCLYLANPYYHFGRVTEDV